VGVEGEVTLAAGVAGDGERRSRRTAARTAPPNSAKSGAIRGR
jgi:hypothetical protein